MRDDDGESPLDIAMYGIYNEDCKYRYSPLDRALEGIYNKDCMDVALYLMSRGCACGDEDKAGLLCVACDFGKLGVVKELVEQYKVDPNSKY